MSKQRKKKILTESNVNISNNEYGENNQNVLIWKQKLAQSLSNCKEYCK